MERFEGKAIRTPLPTHSRPSKAKVFGFPEAREARSGQHLGAPGGCPLPSLGSLGEVQGEAGRAEPPRTQGGREGAREAGETAGGRGEAGGRAARVPSPSPSGGLFRLPQEHLLQGARPGAPSALSPLTCASYSACGPRSRRSFPCVAMAARRPRRRAPLFPRGRERARRWDLGPSSQHPARAPPRPVPPPRVAGGAGRPRPGTAATRCPAREGAERGGGGKEFPLWPGLVARAPPGRPCAQAARAGVRAPRCHLPPNLQKAV